MIDGLIMIVGGLAAGAVGSLLGLGGGILIVPLLTLVFALPVREAVGVSLVCVIVTSGAAAGVYLERRVANLRLGMTLELFTAIGALIGGLIAFFLDERTLALLFAGLLGYVAVSMGLRREPARAEPSGGDGRADRETAAVGNDDERPLAGAGTGAKGDAGPGYQIRRPVAGAIGSVGAGVVSALLGVGGGLVKVPVMHLLMGVPLRVATATSNLMIGVTASASAVIYLLRGEIDPYVAGPTALGVFLGATLGSQVAHRIDLRILRLLFVVVLLYTGWQMLQRALG